MSGSALEALGVRGAEVAVLNGTGAGTAGASSSSHAARTTAPPGGVPTSTSSDGYAMAQAQGGVFTGTGTSTNNKPRPTAPAAVMDPNVRPQRQTGGRAQASKPGAALKAELRGMKGPPASDANVNNKNFSNDDALKNQEQDAAAERMSMALRAQQRFIASGAEGEHQSAAAGSATSKANFKFKPYG